MASMRRHPATLAVSALAVFSLASCGLFGSDDDADQNAGSAAEPSLAGEEGGLLLTSPSQITPDGHSDAPHVVIYSDPACPACAEMEAAFHSDLDQWLSEGAITLEYRSVAFVSDYSNEAANAFACMAEESPANYFAYVGEVTAERVNTDELSEEELTQRAGSRGADIGQCITDDTFAGFVENTTETALDDGGIEGTPTILIDGEDVPGDDFMNLDQYISTAISG